MATAAKAKWTPAHDDALAGLTSLKLPAKEARTLLENLEGDDTGDLILKALRNRHKKPMPVAGGPANAAPINVTPPPLPGGLQLPKNMPPLPGQGKMPPPLPARVPNAPISPAVAQLSPPSMVAPSPEKPAMQAAPPTEKPRIRVRAAGGPVAPAPLGGQAPSVEQASPTNAPATPTAAPQTPSMQVAAPPRIRSEEEYEKLAPGTEFVWIPDGHIYRKPAEGGEK